MDVFQIKHLQDTVQKECEERFELTEALSAAKEELLMLKKPPGMHTFFQLGCLLNTLVNFGTCNIFDLCYKSIIQVNFCYN